MFTDFLKDLRVEDDADEGQGGDFGQTVKVEQNSTFDEARWSWIWSPRRS